jgi:DNA-binding response OmpR family regulator
VTKQNLLVVDADPRSLRVLEVSLRNAGYNVAACPSVGKAFEILHTNKPDLILSDTTFADMNGFEFVEQLRQNPEWSRIPFMFLSSDESIESKIRGLELGVEDYLTKPIYIREVIARVGLELARQAREGLAQRTADDKTRFSGSLSEMSVVDLLQTIDVSRKSGVLSLTSIDGDEGMISFDSGAVIHAAVEDLGGEDAVYRLLLWREGMFDLEFQRVSLVERTVHRTTQALLMEGMRRLDEWSRLSELLPPFDAVLEVDADVLRERLRETPDEQNIMLRLIDGVRTIGQAIRAHGGDHVEALRRVVDLYFEGIIREVGEVKESIPVLAQVAMPASSMPPKAPVNTLPGPGPKPAPGPIQIPGPSRLPETELAPYSERASMPISVPTPPPLPTRESTSGLASDLVPTPESLSSPQSSAGTARWAAAPPPPAPRPQKHTPAGFQAVEGGGTILNWAGRVPEIATLGDEPKREPVEGGRWDRTLDELLQDPEVTEAIEVIDSEPPPAPFVRRTPPRAEKIDMARERVEAPRRDPILEYHEPPEVDPPPLTYEQVFDKKPAPSPVAEPSIPRAAPVPKEARATKPARFVWLALLAFGIVAMVYALSTEEGGEEAAIEASVATETASEPAQAIEAAAETETAKKPAVAAATEATTKAPSVYAKTGAEDTYEAQLELARRLKRGARAVAAYRRAIELNSEGSDALAELARLRLARQHIREAAELAERATAIDPSNALAWVTLGAARQMRGDRQGARQAYLNCVKLGKGRFVSECRSMLR